MAGRRSGSSFAALLAAATGLLTATVALSPNASARPTQDVIHEEFTEQLEDFCGQPGLTVTRDVVVDGRIQINVRRPGTPPYRLERLKVTSVLTNEDGDVVTHEDRFLSSDLKVTDNRDGTVTVLVMATGNTTIYDSTGTVIARNPGQTRFEVLVDLNGTPSDHTDDEFIGFLGIVKPSTGRNDDQCAAFLGQLA
jgi:hypothetical protein